MLCIVSIGWCVLEAVERKIEQYLFELDEAYVTSLYAKLPQGKRLRAKLIAHIAGESLAAVKLAAVVEMIHAASLLHDDVIDDARLRRKKPSLNALYGNKTAIMLGDILYAKGFLELNSISPKVAELISGAVVALSIGELNDVELSKSFHSDTKLYEKMIYQKTASLIEASAGAAALLSGKPYKKYMRYGKNLGLAFQMVDDLLDIVSDEATLGKPVLHDYEEGKTTLPYIYLYEAIGVFGSISDKERLVGLHGKSLKPEDQQWIIGQMHHYKVLERLKLEAKALIDEACMLMEEEGESKLVAIANEMIEREF
jgi:octaprenyl-diphosphate synthase